MEASYLELKGACAALGGAMAQVIRSAGRMPMNDAASREAYNILYEARDQVRRELEAL